MLLGIDFGTTRTVVSAVQQGRYPVVAFERGDGWVDHLPGLAARTDAGLRFGGDAAGVRDPRAFLRSIKRAAAAVAPDEPVPPLDVSALDLVTGYLGWLRGELLERSTLELAPSEPLEAMVAVPAGAGAAQRFLTLEAFRRAGFVVRGMLNEPTAAAIEYAHRDLRSLGPRSPKRFLVVYDLGGGTFDASLISLAGRRFELLASEGIARLGGDDFDLEILAFALETLGADAETTDFSQAAALLELCREAKESLGATSRRLLVDLSPVLPDVEPVILPTAELYERCEPLVERTVECLARLMGDLPFGGRELACVYVAGGSSLFPPVLRALRGRWARKVKIAPTPHAATAVGLAVAADPDARVLVREATTRHLGVWREAEGGREKVFDPIVAKGELPPEGRPLVLERRYTPAHRVGHLRYVECTRIGAAGEPSGDLRPLEEVLFPYDPALADGDLRAEPAERTGDFAGDEIVETYTCGADGRISVAIENRTRGHRREYRLGEGWRSPA